MDNFGLNNDHEYNLYTEDHEHINRDLYIHNTTKENNNNSLKSNNIYILLL